MGRPRTCFCDQCPKCRKRLAMNRYYKRRRLGITKSYTYKLSLTDRQLLRKWRTKFNGNHS